MVKDNLHDLVDFAGVLKRLAESLGCKPTQRHVAEAIGLSEQDFHNRKKRETLVQYIANYALSKGISLDYLFGSNPSADHVVIHLPRGELGPVDKEQQHLLERALVVLQAKGATGHYAESLTNNINSFYKAIQDTNRLMAGSPGKKAVGDS